MYKQRLAKWLGVFSLERQRLSGDLVGMYRIMRDIDRIDSPEPFTKGGIVKDWRAYFLAKRSKV